MGRSPQVTTMELKFQQIKTDFTPEEDQIIHTHKQTKTKRHFPLSRFKHKQSQCPKQNRGVDC